MKINMNNKQTRLNFHVFIHFTQAYFPLFSLSYSFTIFNRSYFPASVLAFIGTSDDTSFACTCVLSVRGELVWCERYAMLFTTHLSNNILTSNVH